MAIPGDEILFTGVWLGDERRRVGAAELAAGLSSS